MTKQAKKESVGFQPRYQRLAQMLGESIISQGFRNGDFFCTLKDLVERYGISIRTIRNTVLLLVKQGVLSVVSAQGIYIRNIESLYTFHSLKNVILYPVDNAMRRSAFFDQRSNAMMKVFGERGFIVRAIPFENVNPSSLQALSGMIRGVIVGRRGNGHLVDMGLKDSNIPVLRLNPQPKTFTPQNRLDISTDFQGMVDMSFGLFKKKETPCRRIYLMTTRDEDYCMPYRKLLPVAKKHGMELHYIELDGHNVEAGRKVGETFAIPDGNDWAIWMWDDYPGMGFYTQMLRRGVDLLQGNRLLIHASPSEKMLDELGIPVIGFSPITIGANAAEAFCKKLRNANDKPQKITIPAEANTPANLQE